MAEQTQCSDCVTTAYALQRVQETLDRIDIEYERNKDSDPDAHRVQGRSHRAVEEFKVEVAGVQLLCDGKACKVAEYFIDRAMEDDVNELMWRGIR